MRNHTKKKLIILILGFICGFSILININSNYFQDYSNLEIDDEFELKVSGFKEIGPVYIDDNDPAYNWVITAATYDWCTGSGTIGNPYVIKDIKITLSGTNENCMTIKNSQKYFLVFNSSFLGSGYYGFGIYDSMNGNIINISANNNDWGLVIDTSQNINISNSIFLSNNYYGIMLIHNSDNNIIRNNTIRDNIIRGINIATQSDYNIIEDNRLVSNNEENIFIGSRAHHNVINRNTISNAPYGIRFNTNSRVDDNIFSNNNISLNEYGILLDFPFNPSSRNIFFNNSITSNLLYGIYLGSFAINNTVYKNFFLNNTVNGYDDGTNNQWDNSSIGNYWDDYAGVDANDDGIGDIPYDVPPVSGSIDYYPLWEDGDDTTPPVIEIISPVTDQSIGTTAPNFQIDIKTLYTNSTWYTIDGGANNYTFSGLTGTVNQTAWDNKGDEIITLSFYANDSLGNLGFKDVTIWKDLNAPQITINSPTPNQLCGVVVPTFSLTIVEPNIQSKRYSLNGRPNITFTTETQFSQSEWDIIGNGTVSIIFYIIDKASNINSSEVIVRKDIYVPKVTILSPNEDEVFENIAPSFTVDIQDANLDKMWYTLNFGAQEVPFTSNETIDQGLWDALPDGIVTLAFFANDTAGNANFTSVNIIKDTTVPKITINSPIPNQLCGVDAPTFSLTIDEPNIQTKLYSINGRPNITFTTQTQFSQSEWNTAGNGTISITFYVIDKVGNTNSSEVILRKDANIPDITIHSPVQDEIFGSTPPEFNISIIEEDLMSMWYIVEGNITQYPFTGVTGTISQEAWDHAIEGDVIITFYAQDRAGNIGIESVTIIKNIPSQPSILGYNLFVLLGVLSVAIIIIERKWRNLRD